MVKEAEGQLGLFPIIAVGAVTVGNEVIVIEVDDEDQILYSVLSARKKYVPFAYTTNGLTALDVLVPVAVVCQ